MRATYTLLSAPYLLSGGMTTFGPQVCIHSATVTQVSRSLTSVTAKLPSRAPLLAFEIDGQQDVAIGQIQPLHGADASGL